MGPKGAAVVVTGASSRIGREPRCNWWRKKGTRKQPVVKIGLRNV